MPNRFVTRHPKGWAVQAPGGKRASSLHPTQREVEMAAKETVQKLGGGRSPHPGEEWPLA